MPELKLKIGCTQEELKQAQSLHYEVFGLEMNTRGIPHDRNDLDSDEFDACCEHIIVTDTENHQVVGTYRMLLDGVAKDHHGFYSEGKFNIDNIKKLPGYKLEVGRSCVHKDYRHNQVLNLLWQGIVRYAMDHQVRYIFGCANIMTANPQAISAYFNMFKHLGLYQDLGASPVHPREAIVPSEEISVANPKKLYNNLPTLFKGYMHVGLKVCSLPVEGDFGTAVFFVLLDIAHMNPSYKRRFFGHYLEETVKK